MRRLTAALLAVLLLLAGCANGSETPPTTPSASRDSSSAAGQEETPREETAIPFTLAAYPAYSFHPVLAANRANLTLAPLLYEGLFLVDEGFQAVPVLCRSYSSSEDKLVWTFILRAGITFSDGTPLTAVEAAAALELARSPRGRYAQRLNDVVSITGEGQALTVTLRRPNGSLPLLLDIPIALGEGDRPAGTGPYVLSGEEELVLAARTGWWQEEKQLPLERIPLHPVSKSEELIYAFDAGDVSLVDVDLMATSAMGYGGNYQTWDYSTTGMIYLGFNLQRGPCRSREVRTALARGVDREAVARESYANHAIPSALPVHPRSSLYQEEAAGRLDYAPEELAGQLEGLRLGEQTLRLVVNTENIAKAAAARLIAYQLEAAGLKVELQQLPFEDYSAALSRGEFDLYLAEVVLTAGFDLDPLLGSGGGMNYGGWWDGETDALLSALRAAPEEGRALAAEALFARLEEQLPILPICFKNGSVLTQWGRLSGLSPVRGNVFYKLEEWTVNQRDRQ